MNVPLGGGPIETTPGRSQAQACLCDPTLFNLKWGEYTYQREYAQKMHYILMPQAQWEKGAADHLAAHPHNWAVHQWIARTQAARLEYQRQASNRVVVEMPDADELTLRVWKDMIENPCQYGDDITDWLVLDEEVMRGPKRWRAGAYWIRQAEEEAALEARKAAEEERRMRHVYATRIQALWRGYSTRVRQTWRDCAKCLAHGICVETLDGEHHVCRCCWGEANPVEDDIATPVEERDVWGPAT